MKGDAGPFQFEGDRRGVVCIHGFTATPYQMRYLGSELARSGMTVTGPLLPGHATTPEDLARTTWHNWLKAVEAAIAGLRHRCDQIALVGQSLGGLLALKVAATPKSDLTAVASLAAPLWLGPLGRAAAAISGWLPGLDMLPKTGIDIRDPSVKQTLPTYDVIPSAPLRSVIELARDVHSRLHDIRCPTLVLHSKKDHTAPYECSEIIAAEVSSRYVRHRAFEDSYHLLSMDYERNIVATEVVDFLQHHFSRGDQGEIRRLD